uniref:Uncharacterized protein n=1 Tax=Arundo donax TaxID=35708 RepID=A0A0A8Y3N4_ARUDO
MLPAQRRRVESARCPGMGKEHYCHRRCRLPESDAIRRCVRPRYESIRLGQPPHAGCA